MAKKELSYCDQRLEAFGITPEWNTVSFPTNGDQEGKKKKSQTTYTIFSDRAGDIEIKYIGLNGLPETYVKPGNKNPVVFTRWRLNPSKVTDDQKYSQPEKSGVHIFLNPKIVEAYKAGTKIKSLFMVEGEFKSWLGYMNGLYIVGLPSISAYKKKDTDMLHETLRELIRVCQVEDLIMIYDADIHAVKWEKFEKNESYDLGKRANLFFSSARNIRDYAKRLVKDVYLCHISSDYLSKYNGNDSVKGLDDLLIFNKGKESEVISELQKLRSSNKMFTYLNITAESPAKIREFFRLRKDKEGKPEQFFALHYSRLMDKEFVFLGFRYKYNNVLDKLEVMEHPDSKNFIRVACDYIKVIQIPEVIRGIRVIRRKLEPWKAGEISRDYVNKGYKNFFDTIAKYDQFTVIPDNTEGYKQVFENCYNLYYQVTHIPTPGKWDTIKMFLEHLFQDQLDMCFDYLKLLYLVPWQPLPIISLVSEERGTGKTKFLELLREIFCENATILGNEAITDNYNDDYASKLIIGIDEGLIEKKATVEKIKSWSTASRIKMSAKFQSRQEIPFFGHIVITSNNTDSFIQIEDKETRFWVREIKPIAKEDPKLMNKMIDEIPAFLNFLNQREMVYKEETRHWFRYDLLKTKALRTLMENSYSWLYKELRIFLEEEFLKYRYHCLSYTLNEVFDILNNRPGGAKFRIHEVQKELKKNFKITPHLMRADFPNYDAESFSKTLRSKPTGRYYQFFVEDFLNEDTVKDIGYSLESLKSIHNPKEPCRAEIWPGDSAPAQQIVIPHSFDKESDNNDDLPF